MTISAPTLPSDHPDREQHCRFAVEPAFHDLADSAVDAGWSPDEVALALIELAEAYIDARSEADGAAEAIRRVKARLT